MTVVFRTALLFLLIGSLPAVAEDRKSRRQKALAEANAKPTRLNVFALQPLDLPAGPSPSFEFAQIFGRTAGRPHAMSIAYWRLDNKTSTDYSSVTISGDYKREIIRHLQGLSVRAKLHLTRSFHFNVGAGVREVFTREILTYKNGRKVKAEKSAISAGIDIGLGNRWVLPSGLVIGGNWLQVFIPAMVLKGKNADIPEGYKDGSDVRYSRESRYHDGNTGTFRLAVLDIGYAW